MHVEPNDDARRRVSERVAKRTELLAAFTLGLSYDVAVLQANYIIDRGLRGEDAMRAFEQEARALEEKVRRWWRTSSKRIGLSWKKLEIQGTDFGKPFRDVAADLRALLFSGLLVANPLAHNAPHPGVTHVEDHKPVATPSETTEAHPEQGGATGGSGESAPKRRGRKRRFSPQQLETARRMKEGGKTNNEIAKVLYGKDPTEAQRRSVPTTLKYHFGRKTASKNRVEN
jgi:hypothetical protein